MEEKKLEKTVFLLYGNTHFVLNRFKAGTTFEEKQEEGKPPITITEYVEIANKSVSDEDRKRFSSNLGESAQKEICWAIERKFIETLPSKKNKLMLIQADDSDVAIILPKLKEKIEGPFKDVPTITLKLNGARTPPGETVPDANASDEEQAAKPIIPESKKKVREFFLVTYAKVASKALKAKFLITANTLTKGNGASEIVTGDFKTANKRLLKTANNETLDLVVIDGSEFDSNQKKYIEYMAEAGGYEFQEIEIIPDETKDIPKVTPEASVQATTETVKTADPVVVVEKPLLAHEGYEAKINILAKELGMEKEEDIPPYEFALDVLIRHLNLEKRLKEYISSNAFEKRILKTAVQNKLITIKDEMALKKDLKID